MSSLGSHDPRVGRDLRYRHGPANTTFPLCQYRGTGMGAVSAPIPFRSGSREQVDLVLECLVVKDGKMDRATYVLELSGAPTIERSPPVPSRKLSPKSCVPAA